MTMQAYYFAHYRLLVDDALSQHESMQYLAEFRREMPYTHTFTVHMGDAALLDEQYAEAVKHPNWNMGAKISVDSATMMNKGLEFVEAMHLFGVTPDDIQVVVHKESAIHSAVEFKDGSIIAQLGTPDMKIPIAYALSYPKRLDHIGESLDLFKLQTMHFEKADTSVFRCLGLAYSAIENGGSYTTVLNAANEEAVNAFLNDRISFVQIADCVEEALNTHSSTELTSIDDILDLEKTTR